MITNHIIISLYDSMCFFKYKARENIFRHWLHLSILSEWTSLVCLLRLAFFVNDLSRWVQLNTSFSSWIFIWSLRYLLALNLALHWAQLKSCSGLWRSRCLEKLDLLLNPCPQILQISILMRNTQTKVKAIWYLAK